jgi:hypothetical protein
MKKYLFINLALILVPICYSQQPFSYKSLDPLDPVLFYETYIVYKSDTISLGAKAFFIDGQLSDETAAKYPYVFNSINEAAKYLTPGAEGSPMVLYIAPYVYWIDNPDDPAERTPREGPTPYGLIINCEWLRFYGLTDNPENVVLACNRGQTIGARGNFTMFKISGNGISSENITFGNYCNVDLEYMLLPQLNRKKRATAIVQAQLIHCNGDKIVARNTNFISRLNLCPFVGGKRVLFDRCHFESTDDALCGTGVYLNCSFDFYASKPFYRTIGTGAVFLNCDIRSFTRGKQYFTKANGQLALVDTRISSQTLTYIGWNDNPPFDARNYQYNVSLNGQPQMIDKLNPAITIDMAGKPLLDAYLFNYKGKTIYNTYNLLCGDDNWDPMDIKGTLLDAEIKSGKKLTSVPVQLQISPNITSLETGKDDIILTAKTFRFGNFEIAPGPVRWSVSPEDEPIVNLIVSNNSRSCKVVPTNRNDGTRQLIITAAMPSGLEAACILHVSPSMLEAPKFSVAPHIIDDKSGRLSVKYKLDTKYTDQSLVNWYRSADPSGKDTTRVAVSRMDTPMTDYELSAGDIGYYIMASVSPKHIRCHAGKATMAILKKPVTASDIKTNNKKLYTNFNHFPTIDQPEIIPGFWTRAPFNGQIHTRENTGSWYYGEGGNGAEGRHGLIPSGRSASLLYTPVGNSFGDMTLNLVVSPFKSAGQGFSIAYLYMDILIKMDTRTMTGYALRFIRTTKYHDAVDCYFVRYENDSVTAISKPVSTSCFKSPCNIEIEVKGNILRAHAATTSMDPEIPEKPGVAKEINIETTIESNIFGSFGIQFNGGAPSVIEEIIAEWQE